MSKNSPTLAAALVLSLLVTSGCKSVLEKASAAPSNAPDPLQVQITPELAKTMSVGNARLETEIGRAHV